MAILRSIVWWILTAVIVQLAAATVVCCCGGDYWTLLGIGCFQEATSANTRNPGADIPQSLILWNSACVLLVIAIWALWAACDLALISILARFTSRYFDRTAMAFAVIFALTAFLSASNSWQWSYDMPARQFSVDFDREFYTTYFAVTVEAPSARYTYPSLRWEKLTFLGLGYVYADNPAGKILVRRFYVSLWYLLVVSGAMTLLRFQRMRRTRSRTMHGLCLNCGYDLRETPHRCPECGFVPILRAAQPSR